MNAESENIMNAGNIFEIKTKPAIVVLEEINKDLMTAKKLYKDIIIPVQMLDFEDGKLIIRENGKSPIEAKLSHIAANQLFKLLRIDPIFALKVCDRTLRNYNIKDLLRKCHTSRVFLRMIERENGMYVRAILDQGFDPFDYTTMVDILLDVIRDIDKEVRIGRGFAGPGDDLEMWNFRLIWPEISSALSRQEESVHFGLDVRTSELGIISAGIEPIIWQLTCANGLKGWMADNKIQFMKIRYYAINLTEIAEQIVTHVEKFQYDFDEKQKILKKAMEIELDGDRAEEIYLSVLRKARAAGHGESQDNILRNLRKRRNEDNGYDLYEIISELTRYAGEIFDTAEDTPEVNIRKVDTIEREAARVLVKMVV